MRVIMSNVQTTLFNRVALISVVSVVSVGRLQPWNAALLRNQVLQTHALTPRTPTTNLHLNINSKCLLSFITGSLDSTKFFSRRGKRRKIILTTESREKALRRMASEIEKRRKLLIPPLTF